MHVTQKFREQITARLWHYFIVTHYLVYVHFVFLLSLPHLAHLSVQCVVVQQT